MQGFRQGRFGARRNNGSAGSIGSPPLPASQRKKIFRCTVAIRSEEAASPARLRSVKKRDNSSVPRSAGARFRSLAHPAKASSVCRTDNW